jgi:hypothetical protein
VYEGDEGKFAAKLGLSPAAAAEVSLDICLLLS